MPRFIKIAGFVLAVVCCDMLSLSAHRGYSQTLLDQPVSIELKNEPLQDAFEKIASAAKVSFSYGSNAFLKERVNLRVKDKRLGEVLDELLKPFPLTYTVIADKIIIRQDKPSPATKGHLPDTLITIRGRVFNRAEPPVPLAGVSIAIRSRGGGTTSDANGNFEMKVEKGDILFFSSSGYKPFEYTVHNNRDNLVISLEENVKKLDEAVVTGYSEQKIRHLANSFSTVDVQSSIEGKPITQLSQALQGGVTGLTVTQSTGLPGGDAATIKIRGITTMGNAGNPGNTDPLVLVDGVPFNMADVDPTTVEKITILKDAAAASIYGSRAANGVIVITTKRGRPGKVSIGFESFAGVQQPTYLPEFVDAVKYMKMVNEAYDNNGSQHYFPDSAIENTISRKDPVAYPNTDWMKLIVKPSVLMQSHTVNVSGGNSIARFAVNANYLKQEGIMKSTGASKFALRANTSVTLKQNLLMYLDMSVMRKEQMLPIQRYGNIGGSPVGYILWELYRIPPTITAKYPLWPDGYQAYGKFGDMQNPLAELERGGYQESKVDIVSVNFQPQWSITPDLKLRGQYLFRINSSQSIKDRDAYNFFNYYNGQLDFTYAAMKTPSTDRSTYEYLSSTLDYSKALGKHYIYALGGVSREIDNISNYDIATLASYFVKLNYVFNDKYLFESAWRRDGSSRFGPGHKWGNFPSVAIGWNIHKENFMRWAHFLNNFKWRASYGMLGSNLNIGLYQYQNLINVTNGVESVIGNPDITWETVKMLDIGTDVGVFDNKLTMTFDWYNKLTDNILLSPPLSLSSGIGTVPINAGSVRNRGWELSLGYSTQLTKDLSASLNAGYSFYQNRITKLRGGPYINTNMINKEGSPIGVFWGYRTDGLLQQKDIDANVARLSGQQAGDIKYIDRNKDGNINESDKEIIGNPNPQGNYFVNLRFVYKNFDLETQVNGFTRTDAMLSGLYAAVPLNPSNTSGGGVPMTWQTNYWTPENTRAYFPRLALDQTNNLQPSDYWMVNAAFARVRFIQLGYSVKAAALTRMGVQSLRVYANAQNPFTFSPMKHLDPESKGGEQTYPLMKVYTLGVSLKF